MQECPCCYEPLLRHIHKHKICWFCPKCRAMMPALSEVKITSNISIRMSIRPGMLKLKEVSYKIGG